MAGVNGKPPELTSVRGAETMLLDADKLTALFATEGWVARLDGAGGIRGSRHGKLEEDEFHADAASLDLWPRLNQTKEMNLTGGVLLKTRTDKKARCAFSRQARFAWSLAKEKTARPASPRVRRRSRREVWNGPMRPRNQTLHPLEQNCKQTSCCWHSEQRASPGNWKPRGTYKPERAIAGHALADCQRQ